MMLLGADLPPRQTAWRRTARSHDSGRIYVSEDPDVVMRRCSVVPSPPAARSSRRRRRHEPFPAAGTEDGSGVAGPTPFLWRASMELLVNGLLRRGARRERLEVKLFGGARISTASRYRRAERGLRRALPARRRHSHGGGSLRGDHARRIQFWRVRAAPARPFSPRCRRRRPRPFPAVRAPQAEGFG